MKSLKPMLGTSIPRDSLIEQFAIRSFLVSFKLDGIRALVRDGVVLSRSLKPIPNPYVQKLFGREEYEGFDGELIVGDPYAEDVFRRTTSGVMSETGEPGVNYYVFDIWNQPNMPFHQRAHEVKRIITNPRFDGCRLKIVSQNPVKSVEDLDKMFQWALDAGYEGLILRNPLGLYKFGRSTIGEAGLLKMKPFVDAEAEVVGVVELMHNENEAFTNELGRTARGYSKAGKVPGNTLGALVCRTPDGVTFEVGTGFTQEQRADLWSRRTTLGGSLVKYKSLIIGVKDKPRHAVFLGFRDRRDT